MTKKALNGSVDILAKAMRQVFTEAVQEGIQPVTDAVKGVDKRLDGVESNLHKISNQVAHHQKALDGIKNRLPKKSAR